MLSPGEWHKQVPRDYRGNLLWRQKIQRAALESKVLQKGVREACRKDILFFINSFIWQYNPKKKGKEVGPFITWDFQEAVLLARPEAPMSGGVSPLEWSYSRGLLWCYEKDRTAVVEKSREMGASWLFLIFQSWLGLFHDYSQSLNISRSAEAVDHASPNSLFWKLRFIHKYLPDWLKGEVRQKKMYIEYRRTNAVIGGEASTGLAGTGGRAGTMFIDEFSKIREDTDVRQYTASTAGTRFFNGTHMGTDTEFYRLTRTPEIVKMSMHWTQHPEHSRGAYRYNTTTNQLEILDKDYVFPEDYPFVLDGTPAGGPYPGVRSPYYDKQCGEVGSSRAMATEHDIDPRGSKSQFFDALDINYCIQAYAKEPVFLGKLEYDKETGEPGKLVPDPTGPLKIWCPLIGMGEVAHDIYGIGADTSMGVGATPSCATVTNSLGEKVAEFTDAHIYPHDFAVLLVALARFFKTPTGEGALLCWEVQGPGDTVSKVIINLGYRRVYFDRDQLELTSEVTDKPGWKPTGRNKMMLLHDYKRALERRQFINPSRDALEECKQFEVLPNGTIEHSNIKSSNDPSGARLNHADHVIADALSHLMISPFLVEKKSREKQAVQIGSLEWRMLLHDNREKDEKIWS